MSRARWDAEIRFQGGRMSTTLVPPGPKGNFLTGNLAELRRNTLEVFTRCLRDYGDVATIRFGLIRALVLNHPQLIEEVLVSNARNFTKHFGVRLLRASFGNGLLTSEGEFWRRQRRLIQPAFNRERIATYGPIMVDISERLVSTWRDGETRDVYRDMTRITLEIIARAMFGANVSEQVFAVGEAVAVLADGTMERLNSLFRLPQVIPTPANIRRRIAAARLDAVLYDIIRRRRAAKETGDDLLGQLIRACEEDDDSRMTDRQLRDEVFTFFVAGHETTALTLAWGLYLLAQHPEIAHSLELEIDEVLGSRPASVDDLPKLCYTDMVVHEVMRLYPCWYDEPDRFVPGRWADGLEKRIPKFAYFPFGGGPRVYIGNHFALIEAVLVLATIVRQWRLSVPAGEPAVRPKPMVTLRPSGPVWLMVHRRNDAVA
jgi:cytochrome P450